MWDNPKECSLCAHKGLARPVQTESNVRDASPDTYFYGFPIDLDRWRRDHESL
jgi:hypothetical protein